MKSTNSSLLYPFLLSIYPIISLLNHNFEFLLVSDVIRSVVVTLLITAILLIFAYLIFHNIPKAAIFTSVMVICIFSYGHIYMATQSKTGTAIPHSLLALIFAAIVILAFWFIKTRKIIPDFLPLFLILSIGLANLFPLAQVIYQTGKTNLNNRQQQIPNKFTNSVNNELPDIYLIVLDSHTRSDVLKEKYNYDNQKFIDGLSSMGFYVANCSQSNYPTTKFSITSLMNMNYLQDEFSNLDTFPPLSTSKVSRELHSRGYTFIRFENYSASHFDFKEDILLSRTTSPLRMGMFLGGLNEFETMLIDTSVFRVLFDMPNLIPGVSFSRVRYLEHYLQTNYILENLPKIPKSGTPRFIYAHILVPHDPYVFTPEGAYKEVDRSIKGYQNNVQFIDRAILPVLQEIIDSSASAPIILLQGDHGPAGNQVTPEMRLSILNAYYVNDQAKSSLYPSITPVNSFRVIFNSLFNTKIPLLDDTSYYAYKPDKFNEDSVVINRCEP